MNKTIGEEVGPKLRRLLCFVGAGVVCTTAINKWREYEKKATQQHALTKLPETSVASSNSSPALAQKARD